MSDRAHEAIYREGQCRLRDWLPQARAAMKDINPPKPDDYGDLFGAMRPYVTEDNLDALVIYPAPRGGWHADLVLKWAPLGVANTMGSRVEAPLASRAEAEEFARVLLAGFLTTAASATETWHTAAPPVFKLYGCAVTLDPELLEMAQALEDQSKTRLNPDQLVFYLEVAIARAFPGGWFDDATFAAADTSNTGIREVIGCCHLLALKGTLAYPLRVDKAPQRQEAGHPEG